jgi:hypothetical protein
MENEEELRRILAGLQEQQKPTSIFQRIAEAVARGIGTAASPNPGGTLINQIEEIGKDRQAKERRQQEIQNVATQFRLTDLANRMAEKRQISAEKRGEESEIAKEKRVHQFDVENFNMKISGEKSLKQMDYTQQERVLGMTQAWEQMMKGMDNSFALRRDQINREGNFEDQAKVAQQNLVYAMIGSKVMDGEKAADMLQKLQKGGEGLTSADLKLLNKAAIQLSDQDFQRKFKLEMAQHSGQLGPMDRIQHEAAMAAMTSARSEELIKVKDQASGTDRLIPARKDDLGKYIIPPGSKFVEPADYGERLMYFYDQYGVNEKFRVGQDNIQYLEGAKAASVNHVLGEIKKIRDSGGDDAEVAKQMAALSNQHPKWSEAIQLAIAKEDTDRKQAKVEEAKKQVEEITESTGIMKLIEKVGSYMAKNKQEAKTVNYLRSELRTAKNKLDNATTPEQKKLIKEKIKDLEDRFKVATQ